MSTEKYFIYVGVLFLIAFFGTSLIIPPIELNGILNIQYLVMWIIMFSPILIISMIKRQKRYVVLYITIVLLLTTRETIGTYNYIKKLPIKTGMNIKEVRKIIGQGEGKVLGKKGGFAKIDVHPYSSRKITNFCEYYSWEGMTYLLVYIDEKQQVEHIFIVPTK